MKTVNIYTETISPRLIYACNILFNSILKTEYKLFSNTSNIGDHEIQINYSSENLDCDLNITPNPLISQTDISPVDVRPGKYNNVSTLFHNENSSLPFDIFSATFFLLSRYEEYLDYNPDKHSRFKAEDSVAYKHGFIEQPIVEIWALLLAKSLDIDEPESSYSRLLTIDIDKAWRYKHNTFIKTIGGFILDLVQIEPKRFLERMCVLLNLRADPYGTYNYIESKTKKTNCKTVFFVLVNNVGEHNNSTPYKNKNFLKLLAYLDSKNEIGIHPSYGTDQSGKLISEEIGILEKLLNKRVKSSRQHYLKFSLPETYEILNKLKIESEYSMGWGSQIGFRAGISKPYTYYSFESESETKLKIVPFVAMDRTLKDYNKLNPELAIEKLHNINSQIERVGGQFCMLWHNNSLNDSGEWEGWQQVFEEFYS